jgi:hypothetical protein
MAQERRHLRIRSREHEALGLEAPHTVGARRLGWVTGGRSVDPAPLVQDLLEEIHASKAAEMGDDENGDRLYGAARKRL